MNCNRFSTKILWKIGSVLSGCDWSFYSVQHNLTPTLDLFTWILLFLILFCDVNALVIFMWCMVESIVVYNTHFAITFMIIINLMWILKKTELIFWSSTLPTYVTPFTNSLFWPWKTFRQVCMHERHSVILCSSQVQGKFAFSV